MNHESNGKSRFIRHPSPPLYLPSRLCRRASPATLALMPSIHSALLVLALLLCACRKPETPAAAQQPPAIDEGLRTFMGIHTLDGRFKLPDTAAGYYPVAVMFADGGELARRRGPMLLGGGPQEFPAVPRTGDVQLLWQFEGGKFRRAALVDGANAAELGDVFPHWQQMAAAAWRSVPLEENLTYQGITILGILIASPDNKVQPQLYPASGERLPSCGQYVVAIGIRHGSDAEALRREFEKPAQ